MDKNRNHEENGSESKEQRNPYQMRLEKALAELGMRYWEYDIPKKRLYRSALIQNEVGYSAYKENVPESYVEEGIIHPLYARAYLDFYENLQRGIDGRLVFQSRYADGHWGWLDISYTVQFDTDGSPLRAVGIGGDISRYSSISVFHLKNGVFSIEYANDVFYQMVGFTKEEYLENPEKCMASKENFTKESYILDAIQTAADREESQTLEYRILDDNGQEHWMRRQFSVVQQGEEGNYLIPALTDDITEQHKTEQKMLAERNMYQQLLDQSSAFMTVVDAQTYRVLYANRAAKNATRHLADGYVGNICYRCIHQAENPCESCFLQDRSTRDKEICEVEYGDRAYKMTYEKILWNGRAALLECSEDITEQKQNLRLIKESSRQQERIINNIPTGIIVFKIIEGSFSILQVNPAACEILHMDAVRAVELHGTAILKLTHRDDLETVKKAAAELAVSGTEIHYEFRNLNRSNGQYTWISADGKSVLQPDGSLLAYVGYQDVTNRKEKEEEYKRRIAILREMDDENMIAKGRHNLTKNRVLAYSAKNACAADVKMAESYDAAVYALADRAADVKLREKILGDMDRKELLCRFAEGKTDGSLEFRRHLPQQSAVWSVVKYNLFEEPDTHDVIAFMYSYDITERVRENRIIEKISSLEYEIMGLIEVQNHNYTVISQLMNARGGTLIRTGDFDEAADRRLKKSARSQEYKELLARFQVDYVIEQLKEKEVYSVLYDLQSEDQTYRRKRFQFSYLDETKETIMFFRTDITEMYNKEQEQLGKIEKALETANTASMAKTEFFSRMSHDMRTPMNGILGLANLSRDEENPEVLKENIEKIYESGQYLLGLINDTLDFQRIESGKIRLEPRVISTEEIVRNSIDMIRETAESKGVQLKVINGNADLHWYVRVDPMRIKQIFINLLSNAVKFTPAGGTVEFEFRMLSREGMISHDLIIVRDTGIGMSEEFLKNGIFQPFSQESNAVTSQFAGSGLGLSIARRLIELMGGRIEVESKKNVGTAFYIYIDFERVNQEEISSAVRNDQEHTTFVREMLQGKRILLVEDHRLNAEISMRLLKKVQCEVDWVQNGAEAVRCFTSGAGEHYDLVLMDIRMPVMDGLEATRQIRRLDSSCAKEIPIVAMTANAYEDDIRRSMEAGMNAHLSKPIDVNAFYDTLLKYTVDGEANLEM